MQSTTIPTCKRKNAQRSGCKLNKYYTRRIPDVDALSAEFDPAGRELNQLIISVAIKPRHKDSTTHMIRPNW